MQSVTRGSTTPQIVIALMFPVRRGPPSVSRDASHSTPIVASAVGHGLRVTLRKLLPYPTTATAIAALAITSEMKYV